MGFKLLDYVLGCNFRLENFFFSFHNSFFLFGTIFFIVTILTIVVTTICTVHYNKRQTLYLYMYGYATYHDDCSILQNKRYSSRPITGYTYRVIHQACPLLSINNIHLLKF